MIILRKVLWALLGFLLFISVSIFAYLKSRVPDYNAKHEITGLSSEVEIIYDSYGIPHIYAENEADLFRAFGYIHAQDRLFQMEVLRRLADGRLSEVFGEAALPTDRFFRTLSFKQHAKIALAAHDKDSEAYKAAVAYVDGINQYIEKGKTPLEFTLASIPKQVFTLEDMEMIVAYMGYTFEGAFKTEALATKIQNELGASYMQDIFAAWPDSAYQIPVQAYDSIGNTQAIKMSEAVLTLNANLPFPPFHGSNGWVVSGSKTESGKPILANDTHIAFAQPSVWYETHLECPTLKVYGNFLAGVPIPALGHTEAGAWGITMFENDEADFFKEKVNPENENQVWQRNEWVDLEVRKEVIKVKDQNDVVLEVKKSPHGYLLNGAFTELDSYSEPIALWWVYHQLPSKHLEVFYSLAKSTNVYEARESVKPLTAPGLNIMWADTSGNIGWWAAGAIPKRPEHVNPMLILDGSSGEVDFLGWEPFELNPQIINPESGVLYTANNQPADMGNGLVDGYYVAANRARRIEQLLFNTRTDWNTKNMRTVINDGSSPFEKEMALNLLTLLDKNALNENELEAYNSLQNWNGSHEITDLAPGIFYRWYYFILENTFKDELGEAGFHVFNINVNLKRNMNQFMLNDSSKWWDNSHTPELESRKEIISQSYKEALEDLSKNFGASVNKWQWGKMHKLTHRHPMSIVPGIGKLFNVGPFPAPGGRETINNLDFIMDSTGVNKVVYGPALRRIIDMSTPEIGYSVNPTGQSGILMSKHYDDQARMFVEGGERAEMMNKELIRENSIGRTYLIPMKREN